MQLTPKEFIENLSQKVDSMAGQKGITHLRELYEKCKDEHNRYKTMVAGNRWYMYETKKYQIPEKWAHRHGIRSNQYMVDMAEKAQCAFRTKPIYVRGSYNEILAPKASDLSYTCSGYDKLYKIWASAWVLATKCIDDIESQGFDEHGGWKSEAAFDKKGRGQAINVDVYGIDEVNKLCIVQVRQFEKRYKNGYGNVKKNYFLLGYNENGNPFAHPISSGIIHAAIRKDPAIESPVHAAQAWIWEIKPEILSSVKRNGDVALIPTSDRQVKKADRLEHTRLNLIDSHFLAAKEIRENGHIFALDPTLWHIKGQHPTQKATGWYRVAIGRRAKFWDFARPTAD